MKKLLVIIFLISVCSMVPFAQSTNDLLNEAKKVIYQADIHFDKGLFLKGRGFFERVLSTEPENYIAKYYLAYTDYKLAIIAMDAQNNIEFDRYIKSATENCEDLLNENEDDVETKALLSGIYGIQIAMNSALGQSLGSKSSMLSAEALGDAPENPRVLLFAGINKLHTPEFFGGSKTKALEYFKKAVNSSENKDSANVSGIDWGYIETLAWLGKTYSAIKDFNSAAETFNKALRIEPEYGWIKNRLLPEAEKKLKSH